MAVVFDGEGRPREVRWTARRKAGAVRRVLDGEDVEAVADDGSIAVGDLVRWVGFTTRVANVR